MVNIRSKIIDKFGTSFKQRGNEMLYLCPKHNDTKIGSFSVNINTGQYNCFACNFKGSVLSKKDMQVNISIVEYKTEEKEKIWLNNDKLKHNQRAYNRFKSYLNHRGINSNLLDDFNITITGWGAEDSYSCGVVVGENSVYKYTLNLDNSLKISNNTKLKMWVKNSDAIPLLLFPKQFTTDDNGAVDFYIFEGLEDLIAFYNLCKGSGFMFFNKSCFVCLFGIYNIAKLNLELLAKNNIDNKFYWCCDNDNVARLKFKEFYNKINQQLINLSSVLEVNNVKDYNELLVSYKINTTEVSI